MKLKNGINVDYKVVDSKTITEHTVSVNLGLSDIEIVVKTFEGEDEKEVIENAVSQFVRQAYPKIDNEIKEIEDKEYAEELARKESEAIAEAEKIAKEEAKAETKKLAEAEEEAQAYADDFNSKQ